VNQFANSDKVEQIYLPNSYNSIGVYSFYYATALKEVHFYDATSGGATAASSLDIGNFAFYGDTVLTSFAFPSIPTTIGSAAFYGDDFTSLDLSHVTSIGFGALGGNLDLTDVTFSTALTSMGSSLFWGDTALKTLSIPSTITVVPDGVCNGCSSLTTVNLDGQVTMIDSGAFVDCESLINIALPSSLTSIGTSAYSLSNVHRPLFIDYNGTKTQWDAVSKGSNWNHNRTVYLRCLSESKTITSGLNVLDYLKANPNNGTTNAGYTVDVTCADGTIHYLDSSDQYTVDMADNAKSIAGWGDYHDDANLVGIKLNATNSTLATGAFYGDTNLTYVDCSACTNMAIGNQAFRGCTSLDSFIPGVSVSSISDEAFEDCTSLVEVEVSSTSTLSIGKSVFVNDTALKSVTLAATTDLTLSNNVCYDDDALTSLTLYSGGTMSLGNSDFQSDGALANVYLESAGKCTLGNSCFDSDASLATLDLSKASQLSIGSGCFNSDNALTSLTLPSTLKAIPSWSLDVDTDYKSVVLTVTYGGTKADFKKILSGSSTSGKQLSNRTTLKVACSDGTLSYSN
jgi:hypothetical protein